MIIIGYSLMFKLLLMITLSAMADRWIVSVIVIVISLQAMVGWGETLRRWYGRSVNVDRQLDVSSDYIGYYTDNGNITS